MPRNRFFSDHELPTLSGFISAKKRVKKGTTHCSNSTTGWSPFLPCFGNIINQHVNYQWMRWSSQKSQPNLAWKSSWTLKPKRVTYWHSKFALENASPHLCTPRALAIGWWWTFLAPTLERGTGSYRLLLYKSSSFHWPSCQEDICHRYYLSEQMKLPRSLEELQ